MKVSARNQLTGKVTKVQLGAVMAEVEVDVGGQPVVSVITKHSAESMKLAAGDDVVVIIKSTEVMIGK